LSIRNFKEIPNIAKRSCTRELKIFPSRRWARKNIGMEYQNLIGFRVDEKERILKNKNKWKKVQNKFPLNERGINKYMVNSFWNEKEYKLDLVPILGNCTLCFMKGKNAIINILKHFPELATPWIQDEEKAKETFGHTYLNNISIKEPDIFFFLVYRKNGYYLYSKENIDYSGINGILVCCIKNGVVIEKDNYFFYGNKFDYAKIWVKLSELKDKTKYKDFI